jgi:hypothetical protein
MKRCSLRRALLSLLVVGFVLTVAGGNVLAQKQKYTIRAIARGTSTQLGKLINVDIYINALSAPEEQKALLEAFQANGSEGLANALDKLPAKGRISVTGTVGYDLNYIRLFNMPDGSRMIRFVTDRPVRFGEVYASTRSMDYKITVGEIIIPKDKDQKKMKGTLLPAVWVKLDKKGEIEMEAYQNPWELTNMKVYNK